VLYLTSILVQTPLIEIVNCLDMALNDKFDEITREIVVKAQKASTTMAGSIDNLLKLTEVEDVPLTGVEDTFNLKLSGRFIDHYERVVWLNPPSIESFTGLTERGKA
jgi:hypothetical protein